MQTYVVTTSRLNLRSSPAIAPGNVMATLRLGDDVELVEESGSEWRKIQANVAGGPVVGYSASRFLGLKNGQPAPQTHSQIAEVHLPASALARLDRTGGRASPLGQPVPARPLDGTDAEKVAAIHAAVAALDVERSQRYQPTDQHTYCNIYACDLIYAARVYLPRVWWIDKALVALARGESVPVLYDRTVRELNANSLYDWLEHWSADFGWTRTLDLTEMQSAVNHGGVGVICGKRYQLNRSGHITCVLPEVANQSALRSGPAVVAPLQSQAGSKNKRYFATPWWGRAAPRLFGRRILVARMNDPGQTPDSRDGTTFLVVVGLLVTIAAFSFLMVWQSSLIFGRGIDLACAAFERGESSQPLIQQIYALGMAHEVVTFKAAALFIAALIAVLGGLFVLRTAEVEYNAQVGSGNWKVSLGTSSPGLVMISLGCALVAVAVLSKAHAPADSAGANSGQAEGVPYPGTPDDYDDLVRGLEDTGVDAASDGDAGPERK